MFRLDHVPGPLGAISVLSAVAEPRRSCAATPRAFRASATSTAVFGGQADAGKVGWEEPTAGVRRAQRRCMRRDGRQVYPQPLNCV